jgi:hypothetical protein
MAHCPFNFNTKEDEKDLFRLFNAVTDPFLCLWRPAAREKQGRYTGKSETGNNRSGTQTGGTYPGNTGP